MSQNNISHNKHFIITTTIDNFAFVIHWIFIKTSEWIRLCSPISS